jgi:uncharacterized repeat protein (TIGR03803 family)
VEGNRSSGKKVLLLSFVALAMATNAWAGSEFKVLHGFGVGKDGGGLYGSPTIDPNGNLYGTTRGGGDYNSGTVFELTPDSLGHWTESVLHNFNGKGEGAFPEAGLAVDTAGNLYGMTTSSVSGFGTVFELKPGSQGWSLSVLDDRGSEGNLILDQAGNLYGQMNGNGKYGRGAISELMREKGWKESWIYSFCSQNQKGLCLDGWDAFAGVTWGPGGTLYGTTLYGGDSSYCGNTGSGVVYELKPQSNGSWKETVLHSFPAFKGDGSVLYDGVVLDKSGNIYGASSQGGSANCGVIFKLTSTADGKWAETLLHDFTNRAEGCGANTLTFDKKGNLWGTAQGGTGTQCADGCGVVFKMTPGANGKWKYSVVHDFTGSDGAVPAAAVIFDKHGNLYGTTELGGPGHSVGVVFEITP